MHCVLHRRQFLHKTHPSSASEVFMTDAQITAKTGRGKGVRYEKCEAPFGPFGFWYLTPFPLDKRNPKI